MDYVKQFALISVGVLALATAVLICKIANWL